MKRKSVIILFVVAVALAFTFVPVKSFAAIAQGWHTAEVVQAGPFFGEMLVKVELSTGGEQWLKLNPEMSNSLLATALSALSLQQPVRIWVLADSAPLVGITVQTCLALLVVN